MFNPLIDDLSRFKDEELTSQINDLTKKYNIATRLGNGSVAHQIIVVIEMLRSEAAKRQHDAAKKLLEKQNKDLDGLINVG